MPEEELEPLITECPSCHTRFRVSEAQLQSARGRVRCGACLTVFGGVEHLVLESLSAEMDEDHAREALDALLDELAGHTPAPAVPPRAEVAAAPPALETPVSEGGRERERELHHRSVVAGPHEVPPEASGAQAGASSFRVIELDKTADVPFRAAKAPATGEPSHAPTDAGKEKVVEKPSRESQAAPATSPAPVAPEPSEVPPSAPVTFGEHRPRRPFVYAAIVLGVLLLAAQVLWYQFDDWAKEPAWRGVYASICGVLGCELPVQQDRTLLDTRNLVVRTHPTTSGALLVNAVIVNRADFPQPFPVLELQFTTVQGNLVAARRFEPREYLAGDATGMQLMPPRTPVQIELTMDDPGAEAVNYRLNFR